MGPNRLLGLFERVPRTSRSGVLATPARRIGNVTCPGRGANTNSCLPPRAPSRSRDSACNAVTTPLAVPEWAPLFPRYAIPSRCATVEPLCIIGTRSSVSCTISHGAQASGLSVIPTQARSARSSHLVRLSLRPQPGPVPVRIPTIPPFHRARPVCRRPRRRWSWDRLPRRVLGACRPRRSHWARKFRILPSASRWLPSSSAPSEVRPTKSTLRGANRCWI